MKPLVLPEYIQRLKQYTTDELIALCHTNYAALPKGAPDVSIVIPAYNEEHNILYPLVTLSQTTSKRCIEIIVVNNNSTDKTAERVSATGIKCIIETKQGITHARNAGLAVATGKFIMNADADTIYPPDWIDKMIDPLANDENIALTYGRFAFIPTHDNQRFAMFLYEHLADMKRWYSKNFKEEAVNVYGFNSAFRLEQGLQVGGFDHPPGTNEDGWLALKLRDSNFGRLHLVTAPEALVWTNDRRLQIDGGLRKALIMRVKRSLG